MEWGKKLASKSSRRIATKCAKICYDKKAENIVVLDVRKLTFITDFFVVATADNERQAKAITVEINKTLKSMGIKALSMEGYSAGGWILADFGDVVVHIFSPELREFYDLESLWSDAKIVKWRK